MRYIKKFESFNERKIELIGFPKDNEIIKISQKEFDLLNMVSDLRIQWKLQKNKWTYLDDEKDELKNWLNIYRETGDTDIIKDVQKYNL